MYHRFTIALSFLLLTCLTAHADTPNRSDDYGDQLPQGAAFRIGTARFGTAFNTVPSFKHLRFSPDGKYVLSSAMGEPDVSMFETATGREVRRFTGHFRDGPPFALSTDGSGVAVCGGVAIDLYDTATGKKQRSIDLSPGIFTHWLAVDFSADGKALLLRYWDRGNGDRNGVSRWDIATGKRIGSWKPGADAPVALSKDTQTLATMRENDPRIGFWQAADGKKIREWKETSKVHSENRHLIFSPGGHSLVIHGVEDVIREYETATGKEVRSWHVSTKSDKSEKIYPVSPAADASQLVFTANGQTLASVDAKRKVLYLWEWKTGRELHHFKDILGPIAFSPDGKIVAAGGDDRRIHLWDTASGRDLCPFPDPGRISSVAFAPNGRVLAAASDKPQVHLLDAGSGRLLKHYPDYNSIDFSPDGGNLLAQRRDGSYCLLDAGGDNERGPIVGRAVGWDTQQKHLLTFADGFVRVWDTATGKEVRRFGLAKVKDYFAKVSASADARMVAISDGGAALIHLFSLDTGKELRQLKDFSQRMNFQAERGNSAFRSRGVFQFAHFAPKGRMLLAGIDPNSIGLWDTTTSAWSLRLRCDNYLPSKPLFSPNGDLLALLNTQGDPCLVDAATGRLRHRLAWKGGYLTWILQSVNRAFSADGRLLAAAYDAHTLVLWEVATGRSIHTWSGHGRGKLRQMVFSSDSRRLATVGSDGTALVWDVIGLGADGQLPARQLTSAETKQAWTDLGDTDAAKGHRAMWMLVAGPPRALPLLRERLHPARGAGPQRLARLISDLDSDDFPVRDTATRELRKLGEMAQLALRAALKGKPALELRRRVQGLLDDLASAVPPAESLRNVRAVAVLEHMDSDDSRKLLGVLATGAPAARLTHESKEALERLHSRKPEPRP